MDKRYQDEILRLVNEQNDLYRDVTFDNVTMGLPRPFIPLTRIERSESWIADRDIVLIVTLFGSGGGSGGAYDVQAGKPRWTSGKGGEGQKSTTTVSLKKGQRITFDLAPGGKGGTGTSDGNGGPSSYVSVDNMSLLAAHGGGGGDRATTSQYVIPKDGRDTPPGGGALGGEGVQAIQLGIDRYTGTPYYGRVNGNDGEPAYATYLEVVENAGERNTSVSLTGILNKGYRGSTDVYYRRHDLVALFEGMTQPELRTREITPQAIVEQLNVTYGLYLTLDEIANVGQFPTWAEGELEVSKTVELVVRDTAYGWVGSVTFKVLNGNPLLDDVVIVQLLPILAHPDDPLLLEGRRSGTLSTYEFDFTPWKARLQIDPASGYWANFADVQEVGKEAGLDYWYNNRVVDLPTSAVPNANPRFERVMVQQHAGGGVTGPLYFHYDQTW